jgi:hypothetical protein
MVKAPASAGEIKIKNRRRRKAAVCFYALHFLKWNAREKLIIGKVNIGAAGLLNALAMSEFELSLFLL